MESVTIPRQTIEAALGELEHARAVAHQIRSPRVPELDAALAHALTLLRGTVEQGTTVQDVATFTIRRPPT